MIYFPEVQERVAYEGPESKNALAFKSFDPDRKLGDKTMAEHLRFAICYWHTFRGGLSHVYGTPTLQRSWETASNPLGRARNTMNAAFEFISKLGAPYWCFQDRDIAPEGECFTESCTHLDSMVEYAGLKQKDTGIKLLWGSADLDSHPRYSGGAATNADPHVFAYAAAQTKRALEATKTLKGLGFCFRTGLEGYNSLWNTDVKREKEQVARFLWMGIEYAQEIGFGGELYLEVRPQRLTRHRYGESVEACLNFLREYDLLDKLKFNVGTDHSATNGHAIAHELRTAADAGLLGSVSVGRCDEHSGSDTESFPTDVRVTAQICAEILVAGGLHSGGLNIDAKVRKQSHETIDLFYAHIAALDAFARGLEIAHKIQEDGRLDALKSGKYEKWQADLGRWIMGGDLGFEDCEDFVCKQGEPTRRSGREEMLEGLLNELI